MDEKTTRRGFGAKIGAITGSCTGLALVSSETEAASQESLPIDYGPGLPRGTYNIEGPEQVRSFNIPGITNYTFDFYGKVRGGKTHVIEVYFTAGDNRSVSQYIRISGKFEKEVKVSSYPKQRGEGLIAYLTHRHSY